MNELFHQRKRNFRSQCLRYLSYVLNDHFVLFLLVFIGFLAIQYQQLLQNFPEDATPVVVFLSLISLFFIFVGKIASYLEPADKIFFLAKEEDVKQYLAKQTRSSFVFWAAVQALCLLLLLPLFLAAGFPLWAFLLYLLVTLLVKYLLFQQKARKLLIGERLDWDLVIRLESERKQALLRFFALFTQVKGISNSVKRRAYLDPITQLVKKSQQTTWTNLFLRSYLRNGELLALSLRLLCLALVSILFIEQTWVATGLVLLFNYLLLFQLLALYQAFDYQYLTSLFPLSSKQKKKT